MLDARRACGASCTRIKSVSCLLCWCCGGGGGLRLTEEEQNPEAMAYLARMGDSLREIYSPPRVLELPTRAPTSTADLATIGSSLLGAGAVYTPGPQQAGRRGGRGGGAPLCDGTPPQPSRPGHAGRCSSSPAGDGDSSCADENNKCGTAGRAEGGGGGGGDKGETDHDKAQRDRVASCLSALRGCREELEVLSDELEQAHIQVRRANGFFLCFVFTSHSVATYLYRSTL